MMRHGNDGLDGRLGAATTPEATNTAGSTRQANGNWVLVNCGPWGVRPRRQQPQWRASEARDPRD